MLTGKELILATKPFAKEIRWKSWYYTLTTLFLLVGTLLGSTYIENIFIKIVCSFFSAMLLSRMFIIFHDYQHHTILRGSFVANVVFTVFGIYMITPPNIWKRSHDHHHNNNAKLFSASIGSYPIMTKQKFLEASKGRKICIPGGETPVKYVLCLFHHFLLRHVHSVIPEQSEKALGFTSGTFASLVFRRFPVDTFWFCYLPAYVPTAFLSVAYDGCLPVLCTA